MIRRCHRSVDDWLRRGWSMWVAHSCGTATSVRQRMFRLATVTPPSSSSASEWSSVNRAQLMRLLWRHKRRRRGSLSAVAGEAKGKEEDRHIGELEEKRTKNLDELQPQLEEMKKTKETNNAEESDLYCAMRVLWKLDLKLMSVGDVVSSWNRQHRRASTYITSRINTEAVVYSDHPEQRHIVYACNPVLWPHITDLFLHYSRGFLRAE